MADVLEFTPDESKQFNARRDMSLKGIIFDRLLMSCRYNNETGINSIATEFYVKDDDNGPTTPKNDRKLTNSELEPLFYPISKVDPKTPPIETLFRAVITSLKKCFVENDYFGGLTKRVNQFDGELIKPALFEVEQKVLADRQQQRQQNPTFLNDAQIFIRINNPTEDDNNIFDLIVDVKLYGEVYNISLRKWPPANRFLMVNLEEYCLQANLLSYSVTGWKRNLVNNDNGGVVTAVTIENKLQTKYEKTVRERQLARASYAKQGLVLASITIVYIHDYDKHPAFGAVAGQNAPFLLIETVFMRNGFQQVKQHYDRMDKCFKLFHLNELKPIKEIMEDVYVEFHDYAIVGFEDLVERYRIQTEKKGDYSLLYTIEDDLDDGEEAEDEIASRSRLVLHIANTDLTYRTSEQFTATLTCTLLPDNREHSIVIKKTSPPNDKESFSLEDIVDNFGKIKHSKSTDDSDDEDGDDEEDRFEFNYHIINTRP